MRSRIKKINEEKEIRCKMDGKKKKDDVNRARKFFKKEVKEKKEEM